MLKKIFLGHGIQNYSCSANPTATLEAKGALAVLYDITPLHPSTPESGLTLIEAFDALTTMILWKSDLLLNFFNTTAAITNVVLPNKDYTATTTPFQPPKDLKLDNLPLIKYAGRHYFNYTGMLNFNLIYPGNLKAYVIKKTSVVAPNRADKGPLKTGAVPWLLLSDSDLRISHGINQIYRVVTASGVAKSCTVTGLNLRSVPYAA